MNNLSVLMITKDPDPIIERSLKSISKIASEIIIVDDFSKSQRLDIIKKFRPNIYIHKDDNLGKQKAFGLKKCSKEWVLCIDSDELVSKKLLNEIIRKLRNSNSINGYIIPFQNHFLNRKIYYGGEHYKMLRLFKRKNVFIEPSLIHEHFDLKKGKTEEMKGNIFHYSYRSFPQLLRKFTNYSFREARRKFSNNEKSSLKKIFLYPIHMFYARFIKDKGYKDGLFRIPLDLGFAYMEFLTYLLLAFKKKK